MQSKQKIKRKTKGNMCWDFGSQKHDPDGEGGRSAYRGSGASGGLASHPSRHLEPR